MSLKEILLEAVNREYRDADGEIVTLTLKSGMTAAELSQLSSELGVTIPPGIYEFLQFARDSSTFKRSIFLALATGQTPATSLSLISPSPRMALAITG